MKGLSAMSRRILWIAAVTLAGMGCSGDTDPPPSDAARESPADPVAASPLDGLWAGSWGGGEQGGAIFQPVLAELWVRDGRAELAGFPDVGRLAGMFDVDARSGRVRITPTNDTAEGAPPQALEFGYELDVDALTLTDGGGREIVFQRRHVVQRPAANTRAELVTVTGLTAAGDLTIVEYGALALGESGVAFYEPRERSLTMRGASALLVGEEGVSEITQEDARGRLREPASAVILYHADDVPPADGSYTLWRDLGPPPPNGDAVRQTLARVVRPGTLVFVVSARENVPQP
jgi:hypothetical protein